MEKVEIGGVALIPIGASIHKVEWITFEGRAWLAPLWILSHDQKMMRPVRIVAPRFAPGYTPLAGDEVLRLFEAIQLTDALLEHGQVPPELTPLVEVREDPPIWADAPSAMN